MSTITFCSEEFERGYVERAEYDALKTEVDRLREELAPLRELVGVDSRAASALNDIHHWTKLMDAWDENVKLRHEVELFKANNRYHRGYTAGERSRDDEFAALRARCERAENALRTVQKSIPASGQNGELYVIHFDGEGREIGVENVDPIALIGFIETTVHNALEQALAGAGEGDKT